MFLFWRIFGLNALVLGAATALLLWAPVTVSVPVLLTEAAVLLFGLAVMLIANAVLLSVGLAPLNRLSRLMSTVDLLQPGRRLPVPGRGGLTGLISTFNAMLDRLEAERADASARVLSAQEAERRRIARELHDEVGQSLTAVLLSLSRLADRTPESLHADLLDAQEVTRESLAEVRRLARRLRPGVLEDLGLISALTSLSTEIAAHTGLAVTRRFPQGLPPLDPEVELVLYRVAQEGLTNVVRHADAAHAVLELHRAADSVVLRVADDGHGIGAVREGAGIRGMRERALLVGGRLAVSPDPGGGTLLTLTIPLPREGA